MAKELDHASDAALMDPLFGVIIYICVGIVLGK
jgi:hypothetical protein